MALSKQLILAVDEEDGYVTPLFVSHPSASIEEFKSHWDVALASVKGDDPDDWCVNEVYEKLIADHGYQIEYGEPEFDIRVSY